MIAVYAGFSSDPRNSYLMVDAEPRSISGLAAWKAEQKPR